MLASSTCGKIACARSGAGASEARLSSTNAPNSVSVSSGKYAGVPEQLPQQGCTQNPQVTPSTEAFSASISQSPMPYGQTNSSSWMMSQPLSASSLKSSLNALASAMATSLVSL